MRKIKAIIFDMDGVLIDAKDWHYEALNRALELFGYTISRYDHLTSYDGLPTSRKLEKLSVETGLPRELHRFINEMKQQYTMKMVYALCKPRFNHEYALSRLKTEGYKLAVASNSIRQTIEVMMDLSCLKKYLDTILSNEDVEKAKPHPEIYQKAIERFELQPEECLIVEDNENGIRAATLSGANILVVNDVSNVTYDRIVRQIQDIESKQQNYINWRQVA
jgi:HAD superfamily hydrolase (TIGR01509 family)